MPEPTVSNVGPHNMTERHPSPDLSVERDPDVLLRATTSIIAGISRFLQSEKDWQSAVAKPGTRNLVWEQILFAHEVLDRLMVVMLTDLSHEGWREEKTDERVLPL